MSTAFPGGLDTPTNPTGSQTLAAAQHAAIHSDTNDAVKAIEAKIGINGSAVTTSHDYKLSGVTGTDKAVSLTGTEVLTNKTFTSPSLTTPTITNPSIVTWDGWVSPNETWTYSTATEITVPTNATLKYSVGDRIKLTQSAAVKYFYIIAVTATTLTITGGTDYTLTNVTISANFYSKVANPQSFPQRFNYTFAGTNIAVGNGTVAADFSIDNRRVKGDFSLIFGTTTSITGSLTFTAPVGTISLVTSPSTVGKDVGCGLYEDVGTITYILTLIANSASTIRPVAMNSGAANTTDTTINGTVPFTYTTGDKLSFSFDYPLA